MENKTSHNLAKEFIEQFWKEFGEMNKHFPCAHRKISDFERSCDTCLVFILPKAVEMFAAVTIILQMTEAFVEFSNFYIGSSESFSKNVVDRIINSEKVKTPPDVIEANIQQKKGMEAYKKSLLSNQFLNTDKFNFNKEETNGK